MFVGIQRTLGRVHRIFGVSRYVFPDLHDRIFEWYIGINDRIFEGYMGYLEEYKGCRENLRLHKCRTQKQDKSNQFKVLSVYQTPNSS